MEMLIDVQGTKFYLHSAKTPDRKPKPVDLNDTPSGSSAFASKTDSTEHLERLRQKLHQLRSLPSTSCDFAEQSIAVSIKSPPPATTSSEADLDQDELLDIIYERRASGSAAASKDKPLKPLELQFLGNFTNSHVCFSSGSIANMLNNLRFSFFLVKQHREQHQYNEHHARLTNTMVYYRQLPLGQQINYHHHQRLLHPN